MRAHSLLCFLALLLLDLSSVNGDNPYRYYHWQARYQTRYILGVPQQVITLNNQFPGPKIDCNTNDNLIVSVENLLNEPFLLSWNGLQQRRNSWQDGVAGTNCPIPVGKNFTYIMQAKDQIGSFFYFPSLGLHKAAGGYGSINIYSRVQIPVPFKHPQGDFSVLAGDWFKTNHARLRHRLDAGYNLPSPDGLIINGVAWNKYVFYVKYGGTYRFRISNVGIATSINFRIQGHNMKLVEVEGSHTIQSTYDSLDIHLGQSISVLVTADKAVKDYYVVVSSRFTRKVLTTTAVLRYENSKTGVSGPVPRGPPAYLAWSLLQARSIRRNLTASAARPNPQGSYPYGRIPISRTVVLQNSAPRINGKQRYAVNSVSHISADTPLKLLEHFNIGSLFKSSTIPDYPTSKNAYLSTSVMQANYRSFIEIVFQNWETTVQSWHVDGYSFFVAGMGGLGWSQSSRKGYNLGDAISRSTVQVYPRAWTAILVPLDNAGIWNIRSEDWARQYLGQQLYLRVPSYSNSLRDELPIPTNALLCGQAKRGHHK